MPDSAPLPQPPIVKKDSPLPDLKALQELLGKKPAIELAPGTCTTLPVVPGETPLAGLGTHKRECHI